MSTPHTCLRRGTTSLLVAVALIAGAMLLLGDRFHAVSGFALSRPVPVEARISGCVGDESMRLINPDREQCRRDERELVAIPSDPAAPVDLALAGHGGPAPGHPSTTGLVPLPTLAAPPGPPGRAGTDGISGFEIVTVKVEVGSREPAAGEAHCPAGKVALGGGVLPDPAVPRKGNGPEERMQVVMSAPLLPNSGGGTYGWTATVKATAGSAPLSVVVAAICAGLR